MSQRRGCFKQNCSLHFSVHCSRAPQWCPGSELAPFQRPVHTSYCGPCWTWAGHTPPDTNCLNFVIVISTDQLLVLLVEKTISITKPNRNPWLSVFIEVIDWEELQKLTLLPQHIIKMAIKRHVKCVAMLAGNWINSKLDTLIPV